MKATIKWVDNMLFIGHSRSGHGVIMDAAEAVGGQDSAVRPLELVLLALGGCTGMDVISILKKKRKTVSSLEIEIDALQSEDHPRKLEEIKMKFKVRGPDLDEPSVARSISLSDEKYCSVGASLKSPVKIDWEMEHDG